MFCTHTEQWAKLLFKEVKTVDLQTDKIRCSVRM